MRVEVVDKIKKEKIILKCGEEIEYRKKSLLYNENDVVFIDKLDSKKVSEYYVYKGLIDKLESMNKNKKKEINKSLLINKLTNIFNYENNYEISDSEHDILNSIEENKNLIKESFKNRFEWIEFDGTVNNKLIIGLGNESVFESSITLHHIYGIPYIPGSALKGVFRNYIIQEYFKSNEESASQDSIFIKIFGGKNNEGESIKGNVIFMDSFPNKNFKIQTDVITPHHQSYSDKVAPLDTDDTNPIKFLVLNSCGNKKLKFAINIAINKKIFGEVLDIENKFINYHNKEIYKLILENFIDALNFNGVGAKTSVGYGYFDINKEEIKRKLKNKVEENKKRERQLKEEIKLKEDTKDKSEFQIEIYKINKIVDENKKREKIMSFYNEKIDILNSDEKIELASCVKKYLENENKWKIKIDKSGKPKDKNSKRIEKICDILKIDLPYKK
ncbi:type III-B CRISPR module RAMP protein Cmr6 [Clostridium ihumii]|uniref:type III-B CRISPR module RAMP protein Cmr6 n=1 Tax=Clostridium ihumii TaxID=1470356 RepID=UPI003D342258